MFKNYFTNSQSPSDMCKNLRDTEGKKNEDQVQAIKKMLDKMKKCIKRFSEDKKSIIKENEKIINMVERILHFNQLEQQTSGLKILTPNQMLSRLPVSSAQLNARNNSEKLKNEIRELLYSLYRSKKPTKQL